MPFLKHQYVFYHEDELREGSLFHHTEACSLTEIQTYVPMRGNFRPPPPKTYNYCILHQGMYAFPKGYATDCMGWDGKDLRVTDGMRWNPELRFKASLRHDLRQDEAVEKTYKALEANAHKGCTLSLPCGYGKTVCALALASALRRKTFVLVHTVFLAKQWEDRIKQFIPGAGVHKVRGAADFDEDKGCEFGIGLMQTVKNMSSSMFSNYGFLIIDEAHHLPCQTLQSCLPKFNSRYTLALSATPERIDGLTNFIYWSVGKSAFLIRPSYPNVQVLKAEYERPYVAGDHLLSFENRICTDPARDERIARIIERCLMDQRRKILVLTLRRQHAQNLVTAIMQRVPNHAVGKDKVVLMLGGDKAVVEGPPEGFCVIVATYQLVQEGFDCPGLNTLVLAMPRGDLVQSIGRITRVGGDTNEKTVKPWVIDIVDQCAEGKRKSSARKAQYAKLKMHSTFAQW